MRLIELGYYCRERTVVENRDIAMGMVSYTPFTSLIPIKNTYFPSTRLLLVVGLVRMERETLM
jgi:hypothetical protein